jgi:hypothetical protein
MLVSRQVLIDRIPSFKVELSNKGFKEYGQAVIDVPVDFIEGVEIVLRAAHGEFTDECFTVPIKEVWYCIQFCKERLVQLEKLSSWFAQWLERKKIMELKLWSQNDYMDMMGLLYPCYIFDHAKGFAFMSNRLVYDVADHITECNPTEYGSLRLDHHAIGKRSIST